MFQIISGSEKVYDKEGGEVSRFLSKNFCLTVPKKFVGDPFCALFQIISGNEKV